MSTEDRLRRALEARADQYDEGSVPPSIATSTNRRTWVLPIAAAAAVALLAAGVTVGVGLVGDPESESGPAAPTSAPSESSTPSEPPAPEPKVLTGDVDGDGSQDQVSVQGGRLVVVLATSPDPTTVTWSEGRVGDLVGVTEPLGGQQLIVVGAEVYRYDVSRSRLVLEELGFQPHELVWVDRDGALFSGRTHQWQGQDYITSYRWRWEDARLTPAPGPMHCPVAGGNTPQICGAGPSFIGSDEGLPELARITYEGGVDLNGGPMQVAEPSYGGTTAELTGDVPSDTGEVPDGVVQLRVDDATAPVDGGGRPSLWDWNRVEDGALLIAVFQAIGDSHEFTVYRYDGETLTRVEVVPTDGLTLAGGGPASGGPFTEVIFNEAGIFTLRSERGADLHQQAIQWRLDGDRLVGEDIGPVCMTSMNYVFEQPAEYGACDFG